MTTLVSYSHSDLVGSAPGLALLIISPYTVGPASAVQPHPTTAEPSEFLQLPQGGQ